MAPREFPGPKRSAPIPPSAATFRHARPCPGSSARERSFLQALPVGPPAVEMRDAGEISARLPSLLLKVRLGPEFGHIADTQVRHHGQLLWDAQRCLQFVAIQNADPP